MQCLTPLVLMALNGEPCDQAADESVCARVDERMLAPARGKPARPARPGPPRGFEGKTVLGDSLEYSVESTNFSVQWNDDDATEAYASTLLASLESGWLHLVDQDGWTPPVSSDLHLLTFVLDPTLGGSGFTTVYSSPEYPEGYPVSYVHPGYADADYPGFSQSVGVHEFGHMIQFGVRSWSARHGESWFWEASAEWMADRGVPDVNTYALSTWWYATQTTLAYDSTDGSHAYGMLLLPRYLEDALGPDVVRDSWSANNGAEWADAIGEAAGEPIGDLVAEMAGAYAAGALTESELFFPPDPLAPSEGEQAEGGLYGTVYAQVEGEGGTFAVDGPASVRYAAGGEWSDTLPDAPFTAAITRMGDGLISWGPEGTSGETGDTGRGGDDDSGGRAAGSCGCGLIAAHRAPGFSGLGLTLLGLGWARRRRET